MLIYLFLEFNSCAVQECVDAKQNELDVAKARVDKATFGGTMWREWVASTKAAQKKQKKRAAKKASPPHAAEIIDLTNDDVEQRAA